MLEKRETLVSVTSSSFSALLDMLRNSDKSGRLLTVARGGVVQRSLQREKDSGDSGK